MRAMTSSRVGRPCLLGLALRVSSLLCVLVGAPFAQHEAGPSAVGFSSHWSLDPARSYDTRFDDGTTWAGAGGGHAPRPLLVEVWYPAAPADGSVPMRRGDYLDVASSAGPATDAALARFARALEHYARGIVAEELLGVPAGERDAEDEAALARLLAAPTAAVRDAPAAGGRYPLVIYHSGYGSSFEDNAAFCERLAAHGYVVASSAYQQADGAAFNIDAHDGSLRDFDFLLRELCARPDVDASHLALAGHSGGAHTALRAQARAQAPWDALVVLDTTQDYWPAREPRWTHPADVLAAPERFDVPMLVVTGREAIFDLIDRLSAADRWYLTARDLGHNEFIEQGVLTAELAAELSAGPAARETRAGFDRVCDTARLFLDAQLKGDAGALAALAAEAASSAATSPASPPSDDAAFRLDHVPRGVSGPQPWDPTSASPPEPRQLRGALSVLGAPVLLERLEGWHAQQPALPIFGLTFGMSLCWDLVDAGRLDDARVLAPFYGRVNPSQASIVVWIVGLSGPAQSEAWRGAMLQSAALAAPDDAQVQAAWKAWTQR